MHLFRLIRPDVSAQGDGKGVAEQECPSSQEPSASNGEADGSIVEEVSSKADGSEGSMSERWEATRAGSLAARLLRDVKVPLQD